MNILQVITGLGIGGAEKVVFDLCKHSVHDNENNMVVISLDSSLERLQEFQDDGIDVISLNMKKNIFSVKNALQKVHEIVKKYRIDVVHAHMAHAAILMSLYNVFYKKKPFVFTAHSVDIEGRSREVFLNYLKKYRNHDVLFSEDHHQFYNAKNYSVIVNGIDIESIEQRAENEVKRNPFTFINVARFNEAKNQVFLLDCINELNKKGYDFQLLMVGDGELRNELEAIIEQYQLNNVHLLGIRKDIPELLGQSHVFVLPSKWEGLPISVLEAGATKIPVLTTKVGNLPTLLSENRGRAVEEPEFVDEMENVLKHYNQYEIKAENLYQHLLEHYSLNSVYQKHIHLYDSLL